jgi:hypothetical protein
VTAVQECQKHLVNNASSSVQAAQLGKTEFVRSKHFAPKTFGVMKDCDVESFIAAAEHINVSKINVVNIQLEFRLYKGDFGCYILEFIRHVKKPIVTTLHTVSANPPPP